jgi:hypothetical protein
MNAFAHPVRLGRFIPSSRRGLPLRLPDESGWRRSWEHSTHDRCLLLHCVHDYARKAARRFDPQLSVGPLLS